MSSNDRCPSGKILRVGYKTKTGKVVKSSCVKNRGKPGKGAKTLPTPKKDGSLSKYGYKLDLPVDVRRKALVKAAKKEGWLEIVRRLNLIHNITASGTKNKQKLGWDVEYAKKMRVKML